MTMHVAEIWRYPVKSMAGERLARAELRDDGIAGDRVVHVRGPGGRVLTARTKFRLLGHRATLGSDGEPLVDGRPWRAPAVAADVARAAGAGAHLDRYDGIERFDVLPLLVATDGAIVAFGRDHRRLRPNLVIGNVTGLAERDWPGATLAIGEHVRVGVDSLRPRCVMITFDPDTLAQDVAILRDVVDRFDGSLALNCRVLVGGEVREGDPVTVIE